MEMGPLTDLDIDFDDPVEIEAIVVFRLFATDEEWETDPASIQWDLTREEAARRYDEGDFSSPLPF